LVLLQNDDDLFVCETVALHSLVLSMGQSLLQNGLFQRGKVNGPALSGSGLDDAATSAAPLHPMRVAPVCAV
ncbi:hypothetical protein, partial [Ensifer sp. ENS01]|uniref:hypothetical protein n=1 Tax=Ensifer sp. ENS01 TaxID=2769293 RepID=UPI001AED3E6F